MFNSLFVAIFSTQILALGIYPIREPMISPPITAPEPSLSCTTRVCSTTGQVFHNLTALYAAHAIPASRTKIKVKLVDSVYKCVPITIACTGLQSPVCGLDGNYYSSMCALNAAGDKISTEYRAMSGKCTKPCLKIYSPVCDQNGNIYSNACSMPACSIATKCRMTF